MMSGFNINAKEKKKYLDENGEPSSKRRKKIPKTAEELAKIREERRKKKEKEKLLTMKKKIKYPIEDFLLSEDEDLSSFPLLSTDFPIPQEFVADALVISEFICTFTRILRISPFSPDDFSNSLVSDSVSGDPFLPKSSGVRDVYSQSNTVGTLSGLCVLIEESLCGLINCIFAELGSEYFIDEGAVEVDESRKSTSNSSDEENSVCSSANRFGDVKKVSGLLPVLSRNVTGEDWEINIKRYLVRKHKISHGCVTPKCLLPYIFNNVFYGA